eukprot:scaffold74774_cov66-Phaeocystis_antarctica.AAC.2
MRSLRIWRASAVLHPRGGSGAGFSCCGTRSACEARSAAMSTEGRLSSVGALRPSSEFCMRCSDLEAVPFQRADCALCCPGRVEPSWPMSPPPESDLDNRFACALSAGDMRSADDRPCASLPPAFRSVDACA